MENGSTPKSSKFKNKKGQKGRKCDFDIPVLFHHEPSLKVLPKMVVKPVVQNESVDSEFPALSGYPENSPSVMLNINGGTSFSTILSRKPKVQYSNINTQHINNYRSFDKNSSPVHRDSPIRMPSSASTPLKTLRESKTKATETIVDNIRIQESKSKVPNASPATNSDPASSSKKTNTANLVHKSKKKKKPKKASNAPQGKVNTLTQEQYRSFTEQSEGNTTETTFLSNLEDLGEYPALGLTPLSSRVKIEPTSNDKENHTDSPKNRRLEKQDSVSQSIIIPPKEDISLVRTIVSSPKQGKPSLNKKFNSPIEMNLVDMLSKMKLKPSKGNLRTPTLFVTPEKIKGSGKHSMLNSLDSTGPTRKRGKERETPRKPKLSKIKKVILKERVEKRLHLALLSMSKMGKQGIVTVNTSENNNNNINSLESELEKLDLSDNDVETNSPRMVQEEVQSDENIQATVVESEEVQSDENVQETVVESEEVQSDENVQATVVESEEEKEQNQRLRCAKKVLHCRKFREYCNHFISEEIDTLTSNLMAELVRYQDRQFMKDPIKARTRKRFVCGLKEVTKNLKLRKLKLVIVAPDIEEINSEGGLNDALHCILSFCHNYVTPLMFSLPRRKLGKVCKKKVPLSCVGIFNYEGTETIYKELMELVEEARQVYKQTLTFAQQNLTDEMIQILSDDQVDHGKVEEMRVLFWQSQSNH